MDRLAIDLALLLPDEVMDAAIAVNNKVLEKEPSSLVLSKTTRLPHITLMQAVISKADLDKSKKNLNLIAKRFLPIKLEVKLAIFKNYMTFDVTNGASEIQDLHEYVMKEYKTLVDYDIKEKYFADNYVRKFSLNYVRDFKAKHAFNFYYPHITLSLGTIELPKQTIVFNVDRLAVCHLGNDNTCERILYEATL